MLTLSFKKLIKGNVFFYLKRVITGKNLHCRSHINKDLCEDVKNIVIDDVESDLEINVQVSKHLN
jgi:hypothetical protein